MVTLFQMATRFLSSILSPFRHCYVYWQASSESQAICERAPTEHSEYEEDRDLTTETALNEIRQIVRDFVKDMEEIASWEEGLSPNFIDAITDTSCSMVENAYFHTTPEHQLVIGRYMAGVVFADDLGERNVEVGQFAQRFARGELQMHPALDRMVEVLRAMHDYYPRVSADAIIANTLDALTWMYVEFNTKGMAYKAGIGAAFPHLSFMKSGGENAGLYYLQTLPDLEIFTVLTNDVLSSYKEALAGDKDNYIHIRAATEKKPVIQVLREVAAETLDSVRNLDKIVAIQPDLVPICERYIMGFVDFHYKAGRYRLRDLDL